jgi:hypothetical protein
VGDITVSRTWNAQGSTALTGSNIVRLLNGTVNNTGSFSLGGTQTTPLASSGGTNAFNNSSTLSKSTATVATLGVPALAPFSRVSAPS